MSRAVYLEYLKELRAEFPDSTVTGLNVSSSLGVSRLSDLCTMRSILSLLGTGEPLLQDLSNFLGMSVSVGPSFPVGVLDYGVQDEVPPASLQEVISNDTSGVSDEIEVGSSEVPEEVAGSSGGASSCVAGDSLLGTDVDLEWSGPDFVPDGFRDDWSDTLDERYSAFSMDLDDLCPDFDDLEDTDPGSLNSVGESKEVVAEFADVVSPKTETEFRMESWDTTSDVDALLSEDMGSAFASRRYQYVVPETALVEPNIESVSIEADLTERLSELPVVESAAVARLDRLNEIARSSRPLTSVEDVDSIDDVVAKFLLRLGIGAARMFTPRRKSVDTYSYGEGEVLSETVRLPGVVQEPEAPVMSDNGVQVRRGYTLDMSKVSHSDVDMVLPPAEAQELEEGLGLVSSLKSIGSLLSRGSNKGSGRLEERSFDDEEGSDNCIRGLGQILGRKK